MKPDIKADIWEGAIGWAFGSQIWSGNKPDLPPNPIKLATKTRIKEWVHKIILFQSAKKLEPVFTINGKNAATIKNIQIWVKTRYRIPEILDSFLSASWITKKYEDNDIISQNTKNVKVSAETITQSIESKNNVVKIV